MNNEIYLDKVNEVFFHVRCSTLEQKTSIKKFFSHPAPNYMFHPLFKAKQWDGRISFFNTRENLLPIGLAKDLYEFCKTKNWVLKYTYPVANFRNKLVDQDLFTLYDEIFSNSALRPADHQHRSIISGLNSKRGILNVATSGGKSLIIYSIIRYVLKNATGNVLLVVPSISLTEQMFSDFKVDYGWSDALKDVSILGGGRSLYDSSKRILISTWQSIYNEPQDFFESFTTVIIDEVQECNTKKTSTNRTKGKSSGNSLRLILEKCVNAHYRYGMTGTIPDEMVHKLNLIGYIGPVLIEVTVKELQVVGFVSEMKINNIIVRYSDNDIATVKNMTYPEEVRFVTTHPKRNTVLGKIIEKVDPKHNILILANLKEHMDQIELYFKTYYPDKKVHRIDGDVSGKTRETIRLGMEDEEGSIVLASYGTTSRGWSVKKFHHVIFASSSKSKFRVLQSLARGLRKHASKEFVTLWDIVDDLRFKNTRGTVLNNYIFDHFIERVKQYEKEQHEYRNINVKLES